MNKIKVVNDNLELSNVNKNIEVEYYKKEYLFAINDLKININKDSALDIEIDLKEDSKLNFNINISSNVKLNLNNNKIEGNYSTVVGLPVHKLYDVLKKCGITSSLYRVNSVDGSHALTIARITDGKYNIDSVYYIDATKGRKQDDTHSHFYSYKSFAMTRDEALGFGYYEDETFGKIDIDEYKRVAQAILNGELVHTYLPNARQYISNIIKFLDGKSVYEIPFAGNSVSIKEVPDAVAKLDLMEQLLSTQIEPTKLLSAIERVRQIEYYENPYKFPYSKETIQVIGTMSKPDFSFYPDADKQLEKMYREHEEDYDKTKSRIDLVKVLKKVKEQKEK